MSKLRYNLTIVYDPESEEVEYICEKIDDDESKEDDIDLDSILDEKEQKFPAEIKELGGVKYCILDLGEYFDEETIKLIEENYTIGKA
tara:strand:+ start:808 stop:1071 length:264 start_codon:yes stop_codon:yes gene_type:complete